MTISERRPLLAVFYYDGMVADRVLSDVGYFLRDSQVNVQGLVQRNTFRRDRDKCDMELEELGSGQIFQLSKDRGKHAGGCRLDREAIIAAAGVMSRNLTTGCEILIVNKFGRAEAEGRGLRDLIAQAVTHGIPTLVGVPRRNLDAWESFAADFCERCEVSDTKILFSWIGDRTGCKPLAAKAKGLAPVSLDSRVKPSHRSVRKASQSCAVNLDRQS